MKIQVHIEELILDGLPVDRQSAPVVQAAVEAELSRLLAESDGSSSWRSGGAVPSLRTAPVHIDSRTTPGAVGQKVAQSLHGGLQQ